MSFSFDCLVHPSSSLALGAVSVQGQILNYHWDEKLLTFRLEVYFKVSRPSGHWNTQPLLVNNNVITWSHWKLWESDVVEFFLGLDKRLPYYEFEVSPINQKLALRITQPRKAFHTPLDIKFEARTKCESHTDEEAWETTLQIAVPCIERPETIYFNAHACLGKESERSFWSFKLNPENDYPDFHRPEFFYQLPLKI